MLTETIYEAVKRETRKYYLSSGFLGTCSKKKKITE